MENRLIFLIQSESKGEVLSPYNKVQVLEVHKYNFIEKISTWSYILNKLLHLIDCTQLILQNLYFEVCVVVEQTNETPLFFFPFPLVMFGCV